jgi:hypothetical protein
MSEEAVEVLDRASGIQDFIDLHAHVGDGELQSAVNLALQCIANPNITPATAKKAMLQLQGYAFKFKMQALVYMQIRTGKTGSDENIKKNAYMYASEQCDKLAQTLKYLVREHGF